MARDSRKSSGLLTLIGGAALGAVAMYLSDPERGKRRRAVALDKLQSLMTQTSGALDVASRDFGNRMQGWRAGANRMLTRRHEAVDDDILIARVRAKIGRAISHPHAVKVWAHQGHIELSGPILPDERRALVSATRSVHGVNSVADHTEVHETQDVPSLQGEGRLRRPQQLRILQQNWSPALRATATLSGSILGMLALMRRRPALAAMGLGLIARGVSNASFLPLTRAMHRRGEQSIDLHESIHIAAPPEVVFDTWRNYENFPRFMSNVKEVTDLGEHRSHWVVNGPGGMQMEWDAQLTDAERGRKLAWETVPGSLISHSGVVHFDAEQDGTRVDVQMSWTPIAGAYSRVASVFNGDPTRQMADDLARMKTFIESGMGTRMGMNEAADHAGKTLH